MQDSEWVVTSVNIFAVTTHSSCESTTKTFYTLNTNNNNHSTYIWTITTTTVAELNRRSKVDRRRISKSEHWKSICLQNPVRRVSCDEWIGSFKMTRSGELWWSTDNAPKIKNASVIFDIVHLESTSLWYGGHSSTFSSQSIQLYPYVKSAPYGR